MYVWQGIHTPKNVHKSQRTTWKSQLLSPTIYDSGIEPRSIGLDSKVPLPAEPSPGSGLLYFERILFLWKAEHDITGKTYNVNTIYHWQKLCQDKDQKTIDRDHGTYAMTYS